MTICLYRLAGAPGLAQQLAFNRMRVAGIKYLGREASVVPRNHPIW